MMMQTIGKKMIFRVDYDVSDEKKKQKAFFVLTISNQQIGQYTGIDENSNYKDKKTENLNLNFMQTKRIEIKPRHCCVH